MRTAQGKLEGTLASNGTLKEPFVTTHVLTVPVELTQVPEPEKDPIALVLDSVERVIEPDVSEQKLLNVCAVGFQPVKRATSLQVLELVPTQLGSTLNVPVACPLMVMAATSDELVLGILAAMLVLLSVASLKPAAHVVVYGLLASAADVMPPVAL